MITVENINPVMKGSLLAKCDVHIKPWKMIMHEVKIFQKGSNRWVGMPSREYITPDNEKKYIELMSFDNDQTKNRFRSQIMEAIDKFLEDNPEMKQDDVINEDSDFPF